jgi:hypothetical protein
MCSLMPTTPLPSFAKYCSIHYQALCRCPNLKLRKPHCDYCYSAVHSLSRLWVVMQHRSNVLYFSSMSQRCRCSKQAVREQLPQLTLRKPSAEAVVPCGSRLCSPPKPKGGKTNTSTVVFKFVSRARLSPSVYCGTFHYL